MNKLQIISKLAFKFTQKYLKEYILLLLEPIGVLILGLIVSSIVLFALSATFIAPIVALLVIFPCIIYSFWKGLMIIYALNYAAYDFLKENNGLTIKDGLTKASERENELKIWVSIASIVLLIGFIPSIFPISFDLASLAMPLNFKMVLNTIILAPIMNYFMQVFYFRKKDENYINLIVNCFKIDLLGWMIAIFVSIIYLILSYSILILIAPLFTIFSLSASLFYYAGKKSI